MKHRLAPFIAISKPRILLMVTLTSVMGFFLGAKQSGQEFTIFSQALFYTLIGTAMSCAGASALNNYLERDADKFMKRTCKRPLPAGEMHPSEALMYGIVMVLLGTTFLVWQVNLLSGFIALLTSFLYVLVYTPLKRITWLNTFVGAIPGALPPMGGWAAATDEIGLGAWFLFLILFLWQHPHFYAIAWMYKEDYARGGFKMLPVVEPDGKSTFRQIIYYSVILIIVSALPTFLGMSGYIYLAGSMLMGLYMLVGGLILYKSHSALDAKKLLRISIIYLPVVLMLIVGDNKF